jgi:hypothetical protein
MFNKIKTKNSIFFYWGILWLFGIFILWLLREFAFVVRAQSCGFKM